MATAKKPLSYRERVTAVKHRLRLEGSDFQQWAKANGYTIWQVYGTTRRESPSQFGTSREIAEKLGLLGESS